MKFALAAGVLTGSLPVLSANAADTALDGAQGFLLRNADGAMNVNSVQRIKDCDPSSDDPDVGVLSCGQGHFCLAKEDSVLGGICETKENLLNLVHKYRQGGALKNARKAWRQSLLRSVECDPMADPDVGILSCDSSEVCVPNSFSSMGGRCVSSAPGRRLQDPTASYSFCDPSSPYYLTYDCDCTGLDNATGTGEVACTIYENTCLGDRYAGCDDVCVSQTLTYTYVNFTVPSYVACHDVVTPYSQVVCFEETFGATYTCTINFNGDPCTSCEVLPNGNYTAIGFDCGNAGGTTGVSYYGADILPAVQSCANLTSDTSSCDICNGPLVNPDASATAMGVEATCADFAASLTSADCTLAASSLAPTCCAASGSGSTPAPSSSTPIEPSPAPGGGGGGGATPAPGPSGGTLAPSGGSTITFTKSTWLVSLGLAAMWTFGLAH